MRFTAISDTHCKHNVINIEPTDVLLHAGDFTGSGSISETKNFMHWFNEQPAKHKIFISGNHDFLDQDYPNLFKEMLKEYPGITYLKDEGTEIDGIKIWGRPWTPEFNSWAFSCPRGSPKMTSTLTVIPHGTHILLTHGPAAGILDKTITGESVGCNDLLEELAVIQPKIVVCGHIHQSSGVLDKDGIKYINASMLDDRYKMVFQPKTFDFSI